MTTPTTETGIVELLPCPFCGGRATCSPADDSGEVVFAVACMSCLAQITKCDEAGAIEQWNSRAAIPGRADETGILERCKFALKNVEAFADYTTDKLPHVSEDVRLVCDLARAAIAAMPDSTQLLQTMAGALETCLAMGERELKRSMNLNGDSPYDIGIAALAQFRAQEPRS